jgi:hypothetical protein
LLTRTHMRPRLSVLKIAPTNPPAGRCMSLATHITVHLISQGRVSRTQNAEDDVEGEVIDLERELGDAHAMSEIKEPCAPRMIRAVAECGRRVVCKRSLASVPARDQWPHFSKTNPLLRKLKTVRAMQQLKNTIACAHGNTHLV